MLRVGRTSTDFCVNGRHDLRLRAHQPVRLAVDADQAHQRMVVPGPVLRGRVVQMVGFRPDAQERIVGDQRHRGRAEIAVRCLHSPANAAMSRDATERENGVKKRLIVESPHARSGKYQTRLLMGRWPMSSDATRCAWPDPPATPRNQSCSLRKIPAANSLRGVAKPARKSRRTRSYCGIRIDGWRVHAAMIRLSPPTLRMTV